MIQNFQIVAEQVAILFILMGIGALCRKTRLLDAQAIGALTNLLILVVTPCVIIESFHRPFAPELLSGLAIATGLSVLLHILMILISAPLIRARQSDDRAILRMAFVFANAGFMGIPLQQAIVGSRGVFFCAAYIVVFNCFIWTWGLFTTKNIHSGFLRRELLINPGTIGIALGLPLFLFSIHLPSVLSTPISAMATLNTPLAMMTIGWGLAGGGVKAFALNLRAHGAACGRLLLSPLLMVALFLVLRMFTKLDYDMAVTMVIAAATPVAAMVSIFATRYQRAPDLAVGLVVGTTLLSLFTIPPVVAAAMWFFSR